MNEKKMYYRIRNICGLLGMLLPWLAAIGMGLYNNCIGVPESIYHNMSISATYYMAPALAIVLSAASITLMTYDGYSKIDNIITTAMGIAGMCIVVFPCYCALSADYTGFFKLPAKLTGILHNISASVFFVLAAFNCIFLFTKHGKEVSTLKKTRNKIYYICGALQLLMIIWILIPVKSPSKMFVAEFVMLEAFGFAWLVKGDAFAFLRDK